MQRAKRKGEIRLVCQHLILHGPKLLRVNVALLYKLNIYNLYVYESPSCKTL